MNTDPNSTDYGPEFQAALEALLKALPVGKVAQIVNISLRKNTLDDMSGSVTSILFGNNATDIEVATDLIRKGVASNVQPLDHTSLLGKK